MTDMFDERHAVVLANGVKMPLLGFGCYQIQPEQTKRVVYRCLERMGLDYLDLMLLHQGFGDYYGAFKALQELYREGVLKAIGVSNFFPRFLLDLIKFGAEPAPMVNQVELHPYFQQPQARALMVQNKVQPEAWAPLAELKNDILHDPVLTAIAHKHGKTVAQVILRFLTQQQVVTLVKSVHKERMVENLQSLEFDLDADDLKDIAALDQGKPLFFDHSSVEAVDQFYGFNENLKQVLD